MSAIIWRDELSTNVAQASTHLREATFDSRLDALKEVALTLLGAVDSLRSAQPAGGGNGIKLQDEVQRFETDLIRTALERTGGNQARAARLLGVKHTTLNAKIKRYKIGGDVYADESEREIGGHEIAA